MLPTRVGMNRFFSVSEWGVDYGFVKTLGLTLKEGRDFSPAFGADTVNVLINEEAAKVMGLKSLLEQPITVARSITARGKIIGVVKNFHVSSLHKPIGPLILFLRPKPSWGYVILRTEPGRASQAIEALEKVHKKYNPAFPVAYQFTDQEYDKLYRAERLAGRLTGCFAGLAVFIACLGLFGLATFTAQQRCKEIGIRKVLGANVTSIVMLLFQDFLKPVVTAILIASPLAWYLVQQWLQGFAYKAQITGWVFVQTAAVAILISLLTVGYQSLKAALANSVKSLQQE